MVWPYWPNAPSACVACGSPGPLGARSSTSGAPTSSEACGNCVGHVLASPSESIVRNLRMSLANFFIFSLTVNTFRFLAGFLPQLAWSRRICILVVSSSELQPGEHEAKSPSEATSSCLASSIVAGMAETKPDWATRATAAYNNNEPSTHTCRKRTLKVTF